MKKICKRLFEPIWLYIKGFDYLGVVQVVVIALVVFAHLLLLDAIFTAIFMEDSQPKSETVFNEPAEHSVYQGLYVSDTSDEGHIGLYYLKKGQTLHLLTAKEALEVKYMLLRKIDSMQDKTSPMGRGEYKQLLNYLYIMEYCFFDAHFIRGENKLLVLNDDLTVKTVEYPADAKAIYLRLQPELMALHRQYRQWFEKRHNDVLFKNDETVFNPAEKVRIHSMFDKHDRFETGSGGRFFSTMETGISREDYHLTEKYDVSPID